MAPFGSGEAGPPEPDNPADVFIDLEAAESEPEAPVYLPMKLDELEDTFIESPDDDLL